LDLRKMGLAGLVVALVVSFAVFAAPTPSSVSATCDYECPSTHTPTATPTKTATPTATPMATETPRATETPKATSTPDVDDVMDVIVITPPNTGDAGLVNGFR
jgi:hypothetical protein